MTVCVCGNENKKPESHRVNMKVCRCKHPGPGPKQSRTRIFQAARVGKEQFDERTRLGLAPMTPIEQQVFDERG